MLTQERQNRIRQYLSEQGRVLATDLVAEFNVSEDTVRRDLRELARAGHCRRVYGGALAPAPDGGSIAARVETQSSAKQRLGRAAAALLHPGQTVFIDAGSTNLEVARALPRDMALTIVTNAPGVALALSDHPLCTIVLLGGLYDRGKGACLGAATLREVRQVYADLFVLGTCGLDAGMGVTALDPGEAEIKRAMIEQSGQLLIAATSDKLGTVAPFRIAEARQVTHLVVEPGIREDIVAAFAALDIDVTVAD